MITGARLHEGATLATLGRVRGLLFAIWLFWFIAAPMEQLTEMAPVFFTPMAPVSWLPAAAQQMLIESPATLVVIRAIGALAALLAIFGVRFAWTGTIAFALGYFLQAFCRSYGYYSNHTEVSLILVSGVLVLDHLLSCWFPSFRPRRAEHTLLGMTLVFSLTYALIGAARFASPDIFFSQSMDCWLAELSMMPTFMESQLGVAILEHWWLLYLLKVTFLLGTIAEFVAPLALVSRPVRLFLLATLPGMHLAIFALMNIAFFENIFLMILFIDLGSKPGLGRCVVLFDGVCTFCNRFVRFLIPRDPLGRCRFAASQSPAGQALMAKAGLTPEQVANSLWVIDDQGQVASRSGAAIAIGRRLDLPWRGFAEALWWIPRPVRDTLYNAFAARRYRWFGKEEACPIPTPEERARILEDGPQALTFLYPEAPRPTEAASPLSP